MAKLDGFTETTGSDNRFEFVQEDSEDEIIIGGTCKHIFRLPFTFSTYASDLEVIYKQGLDVALEKFKDEVTIDETTEEGATIINVVLDEYDTQQFKDTLLDTFVQLKITTTNNNIIYDNPYKITVRKPLGY